MIHVFERAGFKLKSSVLFVSFEALCKRGLLYHSKSRVQDILFLKTCRKCVLSLIFFFLMCKKKDPKPPSVKNPLTC